MVKHNNILPNIHLRKHWQRWVKTFFDQPGRKRRRLEARRTKAARVFPRPLQSLRPVVASCSTRYAGKPRIGRGFTLDELAQAGLSSRFARTVGISVDHRRKSRTTEAFTRNVARLKAYREKLVLLPQNAKALKKAKKGQTIADSDAKADTLVQNKHAEVIAVRSVSVREKPVKITAAQKTFNPKQHLKIQWMNQKWAGKREKKAKEQAAANEQKA
jgi:large subunit ribosomal protein L13e